MPDMMALQVQPPASIGPAVANLLQMRQQQSTQADSAVQNAAELELRRAQLGVEQGKLSQQNLLRSAYQTGDPEAVFRAGDPAGAKSAAGYKQTVQKAAAWSQFSAAALGGDQSALAQLDSEDQKIVVGIASDRQNIAASLAKMGQDEAKFRTEQQVGLGSALVTWASEPNSATRNASIPALLAMAKQAGITTEQAGPVANAAAAGKLDVVAHVGKVLMAEGKTAQDLLAQGAFGVTGTKQGDIIPAPLQAAMGLPTSGFGAAAQPSAMPTAGQSIAPPPGTTAPGLAPATPQSAPAPAPMSASTPTLGGLPTTRLPGGALSVGGADAAGHMASPAEKAAAGFKPTDPVWIDSKGKPDIITGNGVTVNNTTNGPIPSGQQLITDPVTGAQRLELIPGPGADKATADAAAAAGAASTKAAAAAAERRTVLDTVDRTIESITANPAGTTGWGGAFLRFLPQSQAQSVQERIKTLTANIGFDKLQAMRNASPTGGALGQVSDFENRLLQAVYGSLEQSQDSQELLYNLKRIRGLYDAVTDSPSVAKTTKERIAAIGKAVDAGVLTDEEGAARIDAALAASKSDAGLKTLPSGVTIRRIE